jgi:uncharacterized protein YecT (DUF1311 family)
MSQVEMGACAGKELEEVQRQLFVALAEQAAQWSHDEVDRSDVNQVQARWVSYRNAECNDFTPAKGGSAYPTFFAYCELGLTVDRLVEVRATMEHRH